MRRYKFRRTYAWTPAIAYTVGLIASDGSLSVDGRHIDMTSVDLEQLRNFCRAMGRDFPIKKKSAGKGKYAYRVQFSDVAYYDFLVSIGLTPNKSKTIDRLFVPQEIYSHFLRGLFDGDGSCYGYKDRRWKSSFMFYATFASASPPFLSYIQEMNTSLIGVGMGSMRRADAVFTLSYAKFDTNLLFRYMYKNAGGLLLTRKYRKLEGFIKTEENDIIS